MKIMDRLARATMIAACAAALVLSAACGGDSANAKDATATLAPAVTQAAAVTPASTVAAATPTSGTTASPAATAAGTQPQVEATAVPPTRAPAAAPTQAPPPPPTQAPPAPSDQSITVIAKNVKFSPASLAVAAGSIVHLSFDNQDAGVEHDLILYDAAGAMVAGTSTALGPGQQSLTFTAKPQRYVFKCSVHPQAMYGTISAQ